ncbi:MAG: methyltransferase domain-containing protein [Nitrospira sp.]|nr:methyltransferase domain-containing protein [Nitrospira sp.]
MQAEVQHVHVSNVDEAVEQPSQAQAAQRVYSQCEKPMGVGGRIAGWLMAHRRFDKERNRWAVSLLDLQPTDRVLEIGCGPGVAVALMTTVVTSGHVVGIDHSEEMLRQATKRNASAIGQGRVRLLLASVSDLTAGYDRYDKCLMVNVVHCLDNPDDMLRRVQRQMNPGGKLVVTFQPAVQDPTGEDILKAGHAMVERLKAAGFPRAHLEIMSMASDSVACAVGMREGEGLSEMDLPSTVACL